jgi:hypothetical protein
MNTTMRAYRRRNDIDMELKPNYRKVWADRMSSVLQMIGCGLNLKEIGKHYGCTGTNIYLAMKVEGHSIRRVRANMKLNKQ